MESKELNIIIDNINEVKSLLSSNQKVDSIQISLDKLFKENKTLVNDINDSISKKNKNSNGNENNNKNVLSKIDSIINNANELLELNQELDSNYSKLITKPLQLLELLYDEIKKGNDLSNELSSISNAINKIKAFENDKISKLNKNKIEIISKIHSELPDIKNELNQSNNSIINEDNFNSTLDLIKENLSKINELINNNKDLFLKDDVNLNENKEENKLESSIKLNQEDVDVYVAELDNTNSEDVELEEDEIEEELIYEDEEIDDEILEDDFTEDEENLVEENDKKESLRPKFDESYLDEDNSNDDEDDLLKYYK